LYVSSFYANEPCNWMVRNRYCITNQQTDGPVLYVLHSYIPTARSTAFLRDSDSSSSIHCQVSRDPKTASLPDNLFTHASAVFFACDRTTPQAYSGAWPYLPKYTACRALVLTIECWVRITYLNDDVLRVRSLLRCSDDVVE
jgi:hypothetical protein